MAVGVPWETVTLTTLSRDRHLFPVLLAEARHNALKGQEGRLVINTAWGTSWKPFGKPRPKRPLGSVVLREGVAERVTSDVKTFLQRRRWYADRGMYTIIGWSITLILLRYSLSPGLSLAWPAWIRKIVFYTGSRGITLL